MTTPCSLSLLLRQNPAVQWCGCSRGSWVQTPLPTLKWEQAAPCCPADVDAGGTSHGLRIPQPTRVAMAPEGMWGWGGARSSSGAWCQPGRLTSGLPRLPKMLHPQRGSPPGNLLIWQPRAGGAPPPRPPGVPSEPGAPWSPPPEWLWDTAGSQHGWWQGWVRCSKMPHAVKKQPRRFHALQGFAFPFRYQTSASPRVPC